MNTHSPFETKSWSQVNELPAQDDIIHYMEHLFSSSPNKCFTRRSLMDSVIKEFGIPLAAAEATGPGSNISAFYTRMTYLITDAVQGKRKAEDNAFAKRLSFTVYQHVSGNGIITKDVLNNPMKRLSKRLIEEARVSVRILKSLKNSMGPEEIMVDLGGRTWDDNIIEAAINIEFNL